jgi:hypothetical protein
MIIILCCLCSSIIGGIAWYRRDIEREGDPCEGSDTFAEYVIDSEGNCIMDRCVYGYEKENGVCVIKEVPSTSPEDPLDLETTDQSDRSDLIRPVVTRPVVTRPVVTRPVVTRPIITRTDPY